MMRNCWVAGLSLGGMLIAFCGCADESNSGIDVPLASDLVEKQNELEVLPSGSTMSGFEVPETALSDDQSREFGAELRLHIPATWLESEMTAMQRSVLLAKFKVPDVHKDIEITISSVQGGIDPNFERWKKQIADAEPREETIDYDRSTARVLTLTGHYTPGFGKSDRDDWTMVGVAFPGQNTDYYLKLTGPKDKVSEMDATIRELVKTAESIR